MFEEFMGLPSHPLVVHAPVVLIPLLALGVVGYALLPRVRAHLAWAVVALAVAAPLSAVIARQSGDRFRARLYGPQVLAADHPVQVHAEYANVLMWSSLGLGVVTLAMVWLGRGAVGKRRWLAHGLAVVAVLLAAVAVFYLVRVGHTGAEMTHGGR